MKIVIVSNDFRVYWKGRLNFLRSYLLENAIDMYVIELFGKGSPYLFDHYDNQENWWNCLFPLNTADELSKKTIKTELFKALSLIAPDIIIAAPITFFSGALGLRWAKQNQKKFIMFDDAKPLAQFKRNIVVQSVRNLITQQIDGFWLPSPDYDAAYPALNKNKIHFFYGFNCINNDRFKPLTKKRLDHKNIICVARLVPVKNLDNLLRAWQILEKQNTGYTLSIIGDGHNSESLNKLQSDLNLKKVMFTGAVTNEQLPDHYFNADAFILPSLSETWGLVVNEAMAAGLPVLLSNRVNAAQSLLKEGKNGFSFDPYDVTEMTTAILKYINLNNYEKESLSAQSLKLINETNYENMGLNLKIALHKVFEKPVKKSSLLAEILIGLWDGKHDVSAWDRV